MKVGDFVSQLWRQGLPHVGRLRQASQWLPYLAKSLHYLCVFAFCCFSPALLTTTLFPFGVEPLHDFLKAFRFHGGLLNVCRYVFVRHWLHIPAIWRISQEITQCLRACIHVLGSESLRHASDAEDNLPMNNSIANTARLARATNNDAYLVFHQMFNTEFLPTSTCACQLELMI